MRVYWTTTVAKERSWLEKRDALKCNAHRRCKRMSTYVTGTGYSTCAVRTLCTVWVRKNVILYVPIDVVEGTKRARASPTASRCASCRSATCGGRITSLAQRLDHQSDRHTSHLQGRAPPRVQYDRSLACRSLLWNIFLACVARQFLTTTYDT